MTVYISPTSAKMQRCEETIWLAKKLAEKDGGDMCPKGVMK